MGNALTSVLAPLLVLGVIIVIHELGHFLVAKFFKIRVDTFSIGFGPRLLGFRWGETDYRLSQCFVGTEMLRQALLPQHSLFIGPKGSGKSALFRLLCDDLGPWKSLLPKGYEIIYRIPATGLQSEKYLSGVDLDELSPQTANDFRSFWLLYIGLKTATTLVEDQRMQHLASHAENSRIREQYASLSRIVRTLGLVEAANSVEKIKQKIDSLIESPENSLPISGEVGKRLSVSFRNRTGIAIITLLDIIDVERWASEADPGAMPQAPCAKPYQAHARATLRDGHVCLVLSPSHDMKVFAEGAQILTFRNANWHLENSNRNLSGDFLEVAVRRVMNPGIVAISENASLDVAYDCVSIGNSTAYRLRGPGWAAP